MEKSIGLQGLSLNHKQAPLTTSAVNESLSQRMVDINLMDKWAYDICDFRN